MEDSSVTHIAGPAITACGRVIQRCSLCGAKLCDSNNVAIVTTREDQEPKFPTWEVGRLIRVSAGNPTNYMLLEDTDRLPKDTCFDLLD